MQLDCVIRGGTVVNADGVTQADVGISGEQIVVSNAELTRARIRNYGRIAERRLVFRFTLGGDYQKQSRFNTRFAGSLR